MLKSEKKLYSKYLVDLLTVKSLQKAQISPSLRLSVGNEVLTRSADKYLKKWHERLKLEVLKLIKGS